MTSGNGRAGNGWDGHLPSDKTERAILNAMDGIEDEDGNKSSFLNTEEPEKTMFRPRQSNTGPKGVREDARRFYAMQKLQHQAEQVRIQEQLRRAANATVAPVTTVDYDDSDDEDDEEFKKYKLERLKEMQKVTNESASMPTFGKLEVVANVLDYPAMVDKPGSAQTYVIVHLQEDYLAASVRMNYKLEELAQKYDQVRFLNVSASDAKKDLDPTDLPVLIAYHNNGDYLGSEKKVGREAGDNLTADVVAAALMRLNVRLTSSAAMKAADAAALERLRMMDIGGARSANKDEDEDEDEDDKDDDSDEEAELARGRGVNIGRWGGRLAEIS